MENINVALEKLGLNDKKVKVYLSLLALGPSPIRKIAEHAGVNRGTTHEALRELQNHGLVSYYHKEKHQHFVAEDPKILKNIFQRKKEEIENIETDLKDIIPQLSSLAHSSETKPIVKYYEHYSGLRTILEDALDSVEKLPKREYAAYSSPAIRPYLYHRHAFPNFTEERIKRKIYVRVIASGPGGSIQGQDERKWLIQKESAPTYTLIYTGKVAMISVGKNNMPRGLIIEDWGIYKTQLMLFDSLWNSLK